VIFNGSSGAIVLVGMPGFGVGAQLGGAGEWHLAVGTTADVTACAGCGTRAVGHGRRRVRVRDLSVSGRATVSCWSKRIWRCGDGDCSTATWTETSSSVDPGGLLTARAAAEICRCVGEDGVSVAAAARRFAVSWAAAMSAVRRDGRPLIDDPARTASTTAVGVDETTFAHARRTRRTGYVTGMVDVDRGRLLDVVEGRSGGVVVDWLEARSAEWRAQITVAALDAFRGYANALASSLPAATLVMDHFHTVALANRAVDAVRRRVPNDTLGHRGRRNDPLFQIRRLLLVGAEHISGKGWDRLSAGVAAGDTSGDVAAA
jgi:transposase